MSFTYAISVGVADVRRDPDPDSELVTQALMNRSAVSGEVRDDWTHVTLSDYEGWVRSNELDEPTIKGFTKVGEHCATPLHLVAVVTATHTPLYTQAHGDETMGELYLSTALPLLDTTDSERLQVVMPGERTAWLAREAADIRQQEKTYPKEALSVVTTYAREFLGVPYLWGGTSWQGIDCSGFVQLCYRMGGFILPRDADQQHDALAQSIAREEMQEGDLIFFGRSSITHVALALSHKDYIHAEGNNYNRVLINSFDDADAHFDRRLLDLVWGIKRVVV